MGLGEFFWNRSCSYKTQSAAIIIPQSVHWGVCVWSIVPPSQYTQYYSICVLYVLWDTSIGFTCSSYLSVSDIRPGKWFDFFFLRIVCTPLKVWCIKTTAKINTLKVSLFGVCMFSFCMPGFSLCTLVSPHSPKYESEWCVCSWHKLLCFCATYYWAQSRWDDEWMFHTQVQTIAEAQWELITHRSTDSNKLYLGCKLPQTNKYFKHFRWLQQALILPQCYIFTCLSNILGNTVLEVRGSKAGHFDMARSTIILQ